METSHLDKILKKYCKRQFLGVFPRNHLPHPPSGKACMFIVNTDDCTDRGEHWVCVYISAGKIGEYFDSFGRSPSAELKKFMKAHCIRWTFNRKRLQSIGSYFCGHYCIFYCVLRARGYSAGAITAPFTSDTGFNDIIVHDFACKKLRL